MLTSAGSDSIAKRETEILKWLDILLHSASEPMNDLFVELDRLGVVFGDGSYVVAQFALDAESIPDAGISRLTYLDMLYRLVQSQLGVSRIVYTVLCSGHVVSVVYYPRANRETFEQATTVLNEICQDCTALADIFYQENQVRLFSVVSKLYVRAVSISLAYRNSCDMLNYCYFSKHHEVVCEAFYEEQKKAFAEAMETDAAFSKELSKELLDNVPPAVCAEKTMEYLQQQCFPFLEYFQQRLYNINGCLWNDLKNTPGIGAAATQLPFAPYFQQHSITYRFLTNALEEQFSHIAAAVPSENTTPHIIQEVLDYISENYTNSSLSVGGIALHFHISQSHLSSQFKQATGTNLSEYIHLVRIREAKQMITASDYTMLQIAEAVGYTNTSTFYRNYKRYEGGSPNQLRGDRTE